jgi:hypothetical protein
LNAACDGLTKIEKEVQRLKPQTNFDEPEREKEDEPEGDGSEGIQEEESERAGSEMEPL